MNKPEKVTPPLLVESAHWFWLKQAGS